MPKGPYDEGEEYVKMLAWGEGPIADLRFRNALILGLVSIVVIYFGAWLFFLSFLVPATMRDSFNYGYAFLGLIIAVAGVWIGSQSLPGQEASGCKVLVYPGSYEVDEKKYSVTIANVGDTIAVREINLLVGRVRHVFRPFSTLPPYRFDIDDYVLLFKGCHILEQGGLMRIPELAIQSGLKDLMGRSPEGLTTIEKNKDSIYVAVFDRHGEMTEDKTVNGLISACNIGYAGEFFERVKKGETLPISFEAVITMMGPQIPGGLGKMRIDKGMPPGVTETEFLVKSIQTIQSDLREVKEKLSKSADKSSP